MADSNWALIRTDLDTALREITGASYDFDFNANGVINHYFETPDMQAEINSTDRLRLTVINKGRTIEKFGTVDTDNLLEFNIIADYWMDNAYYGDLITAKIGMNLAQTVLNGFNKFFENQENGSNLYCVDLAQEPVQVIGQAENILTVDTSFTLRYEETTRS